MIHRRRLAALASAGLIIAGTSLAAAGPVSGKGHIDVLLDGLSSPKALAAGTGGDLIIGQGVFGPPGPVLAYHTKGPGRGTADEIFESTGVVDIAVARDGTGWASAPTAGSTALRGDGSVAPVLDIIAYQATDIDPYNNPAEDPGESNPYGLAVLPGGDALVADAAGNDVLRVTPAGDVTTVARFTRETISTDHIPDFPVPTIDAEAVPTAIAIGRDGWAYVGQLMGFPFRPGSSHIWRVDPNADGAVCTADAPNADCAVWKSGFTSIQDIAINPANGKLYVLELAEDGALAFEEGFVTGDFPPAVLLEVHGNRRTELAPGQLSEPGGVVATLSGVYVTDGAFTGGRLVKVRGNH